MTNIQYGLISETDKNCLEDIIKLALHVFPDDVINVLEIGVYSGQTGRGIKEYIESRGRKCFITGIDSGKDGETLRFNYDQFIGGNSSEVYNQIEDESQHLILIDALHTFAAVVADYYCYAPKVKHGGFLAFHDTAPQAQGRDWQRVGDKDDPDMHISVNKALERIGLSDKHLCEVLGWNLVFDEYDPNDAAGGIKAFQKL